MSELASANKTTLPIKIVLVANLFFWIYFGIAFTHASYPFSRDVWNYTAPTAPAGYTFFGHSIGVQESAFQHRFFRTMFYVEFPSFASARIGQALLFPQVTGDRIFAGISEGGWRVSATAVLSFFQWYLVVWVGQSLWRRWSSRSTTAPGHAPSKAAIR